MYFSFTNYNIIILNQISLLIYSTGTWSWWSWSRDNRRILWQLTVEVGCTSSTTILQIIRTKFSFQAPKHWFSLYRTTLSSPSMFLPATSSFFCRRPISLFKIFAPNGTSVPQCSSYSIPTAKWLDSVPSYRIRCKFRRRKASCRSWTGKKRKILLIQLYERYVFSCSVTNRFLLRPNGYASCLLWISSSSLFQFSSYKNP